MNAFVDKRYACYLSAQVPVTCVRLGVSSARRISFHLFRLLKRSTHTVNKTFHYNKFLKVILSYLIHQQVVLLKSGSLSARHA